MDARLRLRVNNGPDTPEMPLPVYPESTDIVRPARLGRLVHIQTRRRTRVCGIYFVGFRFIGSSERLLGKRSQ